MAGEQNPALRDGPPQLLALGRHSRLCSAQCATWHSRLRADRQTGGRAGQGQMQHSSHVLGCIAQVQPTLPEGITPPQAASLTCSTRRGGTDCTCAAPAPLCCSHSSRPLTSGAGSCAAPRIRHQRGAALGCAADRALTQRGIAATGARPDAPWLQMPPPTGPTAQAAVA